MDKLLFSNNYYLRIAVIVTLNTITNNEVRTVVYGVVKYRSKRTGNENYVRTLFSGPHSYLTSNGYNLLVYRAFVTGEGRWIWVSFV